MQTAEVEQSIEIPYKPFAKQQQFHSSGAKYRLFGGAAGPGKSTALLWEAIMQILAFERLGLAIDCLLLRRTFPELEKSIIQPFRREVPKELYKSYNDSKHLATFGRGSTLNFGYSESEKDIEQYQGAEFHFIGLDETTHFTFGQWTFLGTRNRCKHRNSFPNMAGATNPGSRGHKWVKALWIDKKPPAGMTDSEYHSSDYEFIPASLDDNPIFAGDSEYRRALESKPKALRDAMLYGRWDAFVGQYFDMPLADHVIRAERTGLNSWDTRWASIDWGFAHSAACYWHGQPSDELTITYKELIKQNHSPRRLAEEFIKANGDDAIDQIYLSPDAFAKRTSESTIAEEMGDVFIEAGLPRPVPADNDRVGGWSLMYDLLQCNQWLISDACPRLIEVLPTMTRDNPTHPEDCLKMDGDDEADAARYGLKSRLSITRPPLAVRVQRRIEPIEDMSLKMLHRAKVLAEEKRKTDIQPIRRNTWHTRRWVKHA